MDRVALLRLAQRHYAEAIADELAKFEDGPNAIQTEAIFEHARMLNAIDDALMVLDRSDPAHRPNDAKQRPVVGAALPRVN